MKLLVAVVCLFLMACAGTPDLESVSKGSLKPLELNSVNAGFDIYEERRALDEKRAAELLEVSEQTVDEKMELDKNFLLKSKRMSPTELHDVLQGPQSRSIETYRF